MKVALVVSNLGNAGAQRSNVNLANLLVARGHEVSVVTRADTRPDFYTLGEGISRVLVPLDGTGRQNIQAMREALQRLAPQVVVSSGNKINVRVLLACRGLPIRVVVVERNDPRQQPVGWRWEMARFFTYLSADRVVGISRGVLAYFWWIPSWRKALIHNTFPPHDLRKKPGEARRVVSVGRLSPIKGFDRLIEAFASAASQCPGWSLDIWGVGESGEELALQVQRLGLGDRVFLKGVTTNPLEAMANADFLAVTSRSEGFGNVLIEAMSVGIPVVAYDCPSGPRDILTHGEDGFLVPDGKTPLLVDALVTMMSDRPKREAMGARALESVRRFGPEAHIERWMSVLQELVEE